MSPNQELAVIKNCQEGRLEDFASLYDEYINKIYRYIFFKIHHKETAEDLTSVVFIKALENIKKFDSKKASFSVWIYRIARNTVIDHFRTSKESVDLEDVLNLPMDELNIPDQLDISAKIKNVQKYLEKLTPEQKELVILRVWEGLSYKEIAEIMGKSESSSKTMFSRVINELRKDFGNILPFIIVYIKYG